MAVTVVKRALPGYLARKRAKATVERKSLRTGNRVTSDRVVVPADVLAERIALPAPRSITAAVFGDPLPGRSALDRMGGRFAD